MAVLFKARAECCQSKLSVCAPPTENSSVAASVKGENFSSFFVGTAVH